ncbi:MAG: c-type cytochrome [Ottowia sp.]|nr:c-type cytochrome [Ottowia sp.]
MNKGILITAALALAASVALAQHKVPVKLPAAEPGQYEHVAPTLEQLQEDDSIHPELRKAIMRGYDLFMNTQQLRGKHVFNDMNCVSCHMGEGRMAWSAPLWPTMTTLPDYRGKNWQVNSVEDRVIGCFSFSMNGIPPDYDSDIMVALLAYQQWTARGAPVYDWNIAGRGFGKVADPPKAPDYQRGEKVFADNCALCHGADGQGQYVDGVMQFPSLWGDRSYNWGAGMSRVDTAAAFIKYNMPLGQPGRLSDQDAWDVAYFISAQERPQDPRYEKSARYTREKYNNFHSRTLYGTIVNGRVLGEHVNTGEKPILMPEALSRKRVFD